MFTNIALLSLAFVSTPTVRDHNLSRPKIELWTNRGDAAVYTRGERVRLYFRIDQDAYVTIFRVDTDGRVRVLFPRDPWEDNFARGGRDLEVDGRALGSDAFTIDDYPGVGYLFAVTSADPFVYDQIESGEGPCIANVHKAVDGRSTDVKPQPSRLDWVQRLVASGERVEDANLCGTSAIHMSSGGFAHFRGLKAMAEVTPDKPSVDSDKCKQRQG